MNTTTTTTFRTRFALGTAIAGLCLGAAACGTTTADPAGSLNKAASQQQQSGISSRAAEHQAELEAQAQRERAERADAKRWAQGHESKSRRGDSSNTSPNCRREGQPTHGQIRCTSPQPAQSSARPGSYKYPELIIP